MKDAQFNAWLANPAAIRQILIEVQVNVNNAETTRYLSNKPYVTGAADTPSHLAYLPVVAGGLTFTEQLALTVDGQGSLSFGEIEIHNAAGERDSWLKDVWANRPLLAYIGDPRWSRADFRLIFNGIVADIDSHSADRLVLKLSDKLQRLNTPLSDLKLGGNSTNKDALLPVLLGECHNITPLLTDAATLEYQVHNGPLEAVFEVRDNGVPVAANVMASSGKFRLNSAPAGTITVSAQGDKPSSYNTTIAALIQRIVTGYGKVVDRFLSSDIDSASFAAFDASHRQAVGGYLANRENVLTVCQQLAGSVGAQMVMSRLGQLRLIQLNLPNYSPPLIVKAIHMLENTLHVAARTKVVAAVKIGYCKNWTVQTGLLTSIAAQHKDLFAKEWLSVTENDYGVQQQHRLNLEPVQQDTWLLTAVDAQAEAARQLQMWRVPRTVYQFTATAELLFVELGQTVMLYARRFGMQNGVLGVVVSLTPDWMRMQIEIGVVV